MRGPGDSIYLQGIVANEGGDSGAGFDVRVALSTDTVYDATDVELETYLIPALAQNTVVPLDACSPVPLPAMADGTYYLVAKVDPQDLVTEGFAAESNNTAVSEFMVEVASDRLVVENFNDDCDGTANEGCSGGGGGGKIIPTQG